MVKISTDSLNFVPTENLVEALRCRMRPQGFVVNIDPVLLSPEFALAIGVERVKA